MTAGPAGELAYAFRVQPGLPDALDAEGVRRLQLERLNETLGWARERCSFYRGRLAQGPLSSLEEVARVPLMDEAAFAHGMAPVLALGQDALSRIVTAPTSGTTGEPKRIAFTEQEHRDIVRYLAAGMRMLAGEGEAVAVLFPCERPGGLGRLICEAVEQAGGVACAYGLPDAQRGFDGLAQACLDAGARGVVGFPQHVYALSQWSVHKGMELPVRKALLSADNVAPSLKRRIQDNWDAQAFAHYGTTEMGYGGAVECPCGFGLHIRETDLLFEVVDPESGEVLPDGMWGELVFTTLNRRAMPLIRYRTGDITRILPGPCACGSALRRIDSVKGRARSGQPLTMYELEEAVFACAGVLDFSACWDRRDKALSLEIQELPLAEPDLAGLRAALHERTQGTVSIKRAVTEEFRPFHPAKRMLALQG